MHYRQPRTGTKLKNKTKHKLFFFFLKKLFNDAREINGKAVLHMCLGVFLASKC